MNPLTLETLIVDLAGLAENLEIHHPERDGDWLRPQDTRRLMRLIYQILMEVTK